MDAEIHSHFIFQYYQWKTDVFTAFFLDSFGFQIPNANVGAKEGLNDESIKVLVFLSSSWVNWSTERFMMSADMLIKEMGVAEFSVTPSSKTFVVPLSFVKKLMSNDSTHTSEEAK